MIWSPPAGVSLARGGDGALCLRLGTAEHALLLSASIAASLPQIAHHVGARDIVYGVTQMPPASDIPDYLTGPESPAAGSLWITARSATIGDVDYERLPPVLVAVVATPIVHGIQWLHGIPFAIDEADARVDEFVVDAGETSLGMPLRIEVNHLLSLRREQLASAIGHLNAAATKDLCATLAGDADPQRRGAERGTGAGGRADTAVLMVLQQPWWRATGRVDA